MSSSKTAARELIGLTRRFADEVGRMRFGGAVRYVYNPLVYARLPHEEYLRRFADGAKEAVFLGMNPGPFGMAQTGVPFGEVRIVRDWLGINSSVGRPDREHPKRPVKGFDCARSEVSGSRFWGAVAGLYGAPESFFKRFFVANYCPLIFMEEGGRNLTPDKLSPEERAKLYFLCDQYLRATISLLKPRWLIGIGKFAEARASEALGNGGIRITSVLHPSPASPAANRGWTGLFKEKMEALGFLDGGSKPLRRGGK